MFHNHSQTPRPDSYAKAIRLVREGKAAQLTMADGVVRINRTRLLQNYEAILHCAAIEQMLTEALGRGPSLMLLEDADLTLSQYAEVLPAWLPSLGSLIKDAGSRKAVADDLLKSVEEIKLHRDKVLHGQQPWFGASLRKRIKGVFLALRQNKQHTPRAEVLKRLTEVERAKKGESPADEILETLETLYLSIEAESDVRDALPKPRGKRLPLPAVASIFELKQLDPALTQIFKRDSLSRRLRASALIRNHLVHGSLITPTERQTSIIRSAHELLGQALVEFQLKKNGGHTAGGDFRNGLDL